MTGGAYAVLRTLRPCLSTPLCKLQYSTVVPMKLQASQTTPFRQAWMGRQTTRLRFMNADNWISRSFIQRKNTAVDLHQRICYRLYSFYCGKHLLRRNSTSKTIKLGLVAYTPFLLLVKNASSSAANIDVIMKTLLRLGMRFSVNCKTG